MPSVGCGFYANFISKASVGMFAPVPHVHHSTVNLGLGWLYMLYLILKVSGVLFRISSMHVPSEMSPGVMSLNSSVLMISLVLSGSLGPYLADLWSER